MGKKNKRAKHHHGGNGFAHHQQVGGTANDGLTVIRHHQTGSSSNSAAGNGKSSSPSFSSSPAAAQGQQQRQQHSPYSQQQQQKQPQQGGPRIERRHVETRKALPIYHQRAQIVEAVKIHKSTILVGETGSGKSTQVPQFLLEGGLCKTLSSPSPQKHSQQQQNQKRQKDMPVIRKAIACTQPRRVAAMTVAKRVAEEMGTRLGQAVGYAVRFDDQTSDRTVIKYVTDGVLLREAMVDPLLTRYAVIVLDEAHERSLQTDILFGLIRRAQKDRPDLRVVVMSATLEVETFKKFFDKDDEKAAVVRVEGRQYGVDVYYCDEAQEDAIDAAYITALQIHDEESSGEIHEEEPPGDVLIFLSGQEDIEALAELLQECPPTTAPNNDNMKMQIYPLFAALPQEQQLKAFQPAGPHTRKFILATNIAETSVTINGIRYVVDTGWVKVRRFVASTGLDSLKVTQVAKAQANQRAGRAGREAPGICYRLYTEETFEQLGDAPQPEIQRVNLAQVVLQLMAMGISKPQEFDYVSPPSARSLARALETLLALECIAEGAGPDGSPAPILTNHGAQVSALPIDPLFAHFVLRAARLGCITEALTAVSMLSAENVLFMPAAGTGSEAAERREKAITAHRSLSVYEGDISTLIGVYERWIRANRERKWCNDHFVNWRSMEKAEDVRKQLVTIVQRLGLDPMVSCGNERQIFLRCLSASLFLNVALRQPPSEGQKGCYKTIQSSREVFIHPSSVLHGRNPPPKCVVYTEVLTTTRAYIRGVTVGDTLALQELVPKFFKQGG